MENFTAEEKHNNNIQGLFSTARSSGKHWIFFSAVNFLFSITAILGNTLILIALQKDSSLHPPSKLLYRCLAITDLLVGLITEPNNALNLLSLGTEHHLSDLCFYTAAIGTVSFTILSAVSLLTMTAISVDRLLALLLGLRYRHIVTLRRVRALVIFFWIVSITFASMSFWNYTIPKSYNYTLILLCITISAFCYSKIFLTLRHHHMEVSQNQGHPDVDGIPLNIARYKRTVAIIIWKFLKTKDIPTSTEFPWI